MRRLLLVFALVAFLSPTTVVAGLIDDEITFTRYGGPWIPGVVPYNLNPDSQIVRDGPEWQDAYLRQVDVTDSAIKL